MNLVMLGKPGAGKGSVCKEFTKHSDYVHLSTGDIFRKEIASKSELGIIADSYISKGCLVPDDITNKIIKNLLLNEGDKNYIFDGYPRTIVQAESFKEILKELGLKLDAVIDLDVTDELVIERLTSRRVCSNCRTIYNTRNHNPKIEGVCDVCGKAVIQRDDDTLETITNRLKVYRDQTQPLVNYYKNENLLIVIDGSKDAYEDYLDIIHAINK